MKVFIWFLFFLPIVYVAGNYDYHYDYFQLVLQWPPTVCIGSGICHCQTNFTILGFWPSDSTTPGLPINCPGPRFNKSEIEDLIPCLEKYWPNITGDNLWLWKNQWETHGTCSKALFHEHAYFSTALELKKKVDIFGYLNASGIKPLPPKAVYRISDISEAIKQGTGRKPRLWCKSKELLEISLCYDLHLAYIDCPPKLLNYTENYCKDCECVGYTPCPPPPESPRMEIELKKDEL